ncbi:histidine kinase [Nocardioides sp. Root1257]|uniref:sensor histidine kinase n=1 Tax=unclassified Nocardioides TaxID=2615069 RepID=UPI0006FFF1E9|nr:MULTISPECIES: HAMP domain-containing sensor histidine kinase [unclassified Nocardioides]KQW47818.1 histidine kinase [Nocardioides sp. Root1257]KRC45070.1 histidine kinase [Nocardioides sp. Root224]
MTVLPSSGVDGRWHYRRSLASRVTILTTLAAGATVALMALGAYVTVRMQLQATLDDDLVHRAQSASTALCEPGVRMPDGYLGASSSAAVCITSSAVLGGVSDLGLSAVRLGDPELDVANGTTSKSVRTITGSKGGRFRVVAMDRGEGRTMIIVQSLDSQESVLRKLGVVMGLFGLAGVIGAGIAGWGVARNGLRPVRRLTDAAEHIARTEDLRPLPVEGDDELARLATAFNQMLLALAASRDRQRQLVADAGHELRTPLTSLRTNLDLLSQVDAEGVGLPPAARAELLEDVHAQIEELTTLIGDLVELARDEPLTHVVEPVDLPELVDRVVARVRRRAPGLSFDVELAPWYVIGEGAGLERAVTNLLDNAAKWSPEDGTVTVRLADGTLTVDDQGPGIAPADRPHVFDRFYRSQESRGMSGSGLGLSIVRQVAERHSGTVTADDAPGGGARLVLWLPGASAPVPTWTPA